MSFYFPDKYSKGRQCDRDYMFNVANTLHTEFIKELIEHSLKQRYTVSDKEQKKECVLITEEWAEELKEMPFFSKVS